MSQLVKVKDAKLASNVSTILRLAGGRSAVCSDWCRSAIATACHASGDSKSEGGSLLSDIVSTDLKVGAAVLVADKGKGLDAAIDMLSKDQKDSKNQKKPKK